MTVQYWPIEGREEAYSLLQYRYCCVMPYWWRNYYLLFLNRYSILLYSDDLVQLTVCSIIEYFCAGFNAIGYYSFCWRYCVYDRVCSDINIDILQWRIWLLLYSVIWPPHPILTMLTLCDWYLLKKRGLLLWRLLTMTDSIGYLLVLYSDTYYFHYLLQPLVFNTDDDHWPIQ